MKIFILCTARSRKIERTSSLTLETIHVGFPDTHVHVDFQGEWARTARIDIGGFHSSTVLEEPQIHGDWIKGLVYSEENPFVIADPDLVFFSRFPVEKYIGNAWAGDLTPSFNCPVAKARTAWRFHTSLLFIDPIRLRLEIRDWKARVESNQFVPGVDLFRPALIPTEDGNRFYDTCSFLSHAIGAKHFDDETLECYRHLHAGTWSDIVEKSMPGFQDMHRKLLSDRELLKESRAMQNEFYRKHA